MSRVIGLVSAKGGVGKTVSAINLAYAINSFRRDVVLVDTDLRSANVGLYLGVMQLPVTLHHVLAEDKHVKDALYKHQSGLRVVPGDSTFYEVSSRYSRKLPDKIKSIGSEIVIVDTASGYGRDFEHGVKAIDEALVVTTPDMVSVHEAHKTVHKLENMGVTVIGVVLSQVRGDYMDFSVENIESILSKPVLGSIPYDDGMRKAIYNKNPVVFVNPHSQLSYAYKKLASKVIGEMFEQNIPQEKPSFWKKVFTL